MTQTAKLFMNGRSQAVRLPKEYRFKGTDEVAIRRDPVTGDVLLSARTGIRKDMSWNELFAAWDALGPADPNFGRQVSPPVEREFF